MDFTDLQNEIISLPPNHPVFIYVGVGTAAGMVNNNGLLALADYHQFPPFLQEMRNNIPNLHLFLVLIDPRQEDPPYLAAEFNCEPAAGNNNAYYKNPDGTLQVFVYRQDVHTDAEVYHSEKSINITNQLRDLNHFAIEHNATLLYHIFTGKWVALLAEYFDNDYQVAAHLDHIVYGLSAREDRGCLFDLTQAHAFFPYRLIKNNNHPRPLVKLFNYYHYIINDKLNEVDAEISKFPERMQPLVIDQKINIINMYTSRFKNINLNIMRQMQQKLMAERQQAEQQQEPDHARIFNELPYTYREMFTDLYKEKEYSTLCEVLFHYCAMQLDVLAKLKKMDISGEEMLQFITSDADSYKWYNNMNSFL
jgi:hypothetical protein